MATKKSTGRTSVRQSKTAPKSTTTSQTKFNQLRQREVIHRVGTSLFPPADMWHGSSMNTALAIAADVSAETRSKPNDPYSNIELCINHLRLSPMFRNLLCSHRADLKKVSDVYEHELALTALAARMFIAGMCASSIGLNVGAEVSDAEPVLALLRRMSNGGAQ